MRIPSKLSAFLAVLALAFTLIAGSAAAQEATPDDLQPADLEGLQHGVARAYTIDYSALIDLAATPGAEMTVPSGVLTLSAVILEFDSSGNAETALALLQEDATADMVGEIAEVTEIDLNLGDASIGYASVEEFDGQELETIIAVVQQDAYVYFAVGVGSDQDMQTLVNEFTTTLIDNEGSGAGELNDDATYSGGLWNKFPAADDETIADLIPYDSVIFPEPEGTPAP
ncbi:hypothetical protein BH20CHL3_BH20CHL3_01550 [soil metagenome]